jgi:bis(5'-nucleosyl)-tetraphosphatase (symmetrical)
MNTYIIGDIHGHLEELEDLLIKINLSSNDQLWFTGDLINGGDYSRETIKLIQSLGKQAICILGNHDLILMACAYNNKILDVMLNKNKDNLTNINGIIQVLKSRDKLDLINWLEHRPLAHFNQNFNMLMVHAGIHPSWDATKTLHLAAEVETILQSDRATKLYAQIYGDKPNNWSDNLSGWGRLRCIINYLTRARFCYSDGSLNLTYKGDLATAPDNLLPWYDLQNRNFQQTTIVFGHWSALLGNANHPHVISMDTGCRWGGQLTAYNIEKQLYYNTQCVL